jgi:hypothetical protein
MGLAAAKIVRRYGSQLQCLGRYETEEKNVYTYVLFVPHFPLTVLKPHRSSDGLKLVTTKEVPHFKALPRDHARDSQMPDDKTTWMFPDQLEALKKGFKLFS